MSFLKYVEADEYEASSISAGVMFLKMKDPCWLRKYLAVCKHFWKVSEAAAEVLIIDPFMMCIHDYSNLMLR